MTNKLEIQERGVMLSDYFCGTPGVMLAIHLTNTTTVEEILGELRSEIDALWDHIEYTAEAHSFVGDLESDIEAQLLTMQNYVTEHSRGSNPYCAELEPEPESEYCEGPVAIFSIEFTED
jgi:hypothetical protein